MGDEESHAALARRLRELRLQHWDDVVVTQKQVAAALHISVSLISSWEQTKDPVLPGEDRLHAYARFFATRRSIEGGESRLVDGRQLTREEEELRKHLVDELVGLREVAARPVSDARPRTGALGGRFYHFPDGQPVRVIGKALPEYELRRVAPSAQDVEHALLHLREALDARGALEDDDRGDELERALRTAGRYGELHEALALLTSATAGLQGFEESHGIIERSLASFESTGVQYANLHHPNAIHSLWNADMDATIELVGHIRAENPGSDVRWLRDDQVRAEDLQGHVVLLGGGDTFLRSKAVGPLQFVYDRLDLPVSSVVPPGGDAEFDIELQVHVDSEGRPDLSGERRETYAPRFALDGGGERVLVEGQPQLVYDVALLGRKPNVLNTSASVTMAFGAFSRGTYGAVRALTDAALRARNEQYLVDHVDLSDFWMLLHVPVFPSDTGASTVTPDLARPFTRIRSSV